jgi:hypothetical protein
MISYLFHAMRNIISTLNASSNGSRQIIIAPYARKRSPKRHYRSRRGNSKRRKTLDSDYM